MIYKLSFRVFLLFSLLGCRNNVEEQNRNSLNNIDNRFSGKNLKKTIITGKSDDTLALNYFNLLNNAYLFTKNYSSIHKNIINDSIYIEIDSLFGPQSFDVLIFGDSSSFYRTKIYIEPGAPISFEIIDKKLHFFGKNSAYNNFFTVLEYETSEYRINPYKGDIRVYKRGIKKIYDEKVAFLNQYLSKNKIPSTEQIELLKQMLKYEYLNNLINPISVFVEQSNQYVRTQEGVLALLENENNKYEELFNINDYTDGTTIEDFKRPELLNNSLEFKNCLDAYIRYYFATNKYVDYSSESFLAQKDFIEKNFDGDLKYYAVARLIREYNIRGFGFSTQNIAVLKNAIEEYDSVFSLKPTYKENMDEIKESLNKFNFKLSNAALNTKLLSKYGDTITLKEIFNRSSKRIRVIDFWASWCPPCISEITKAKSFKDKLSVEKNVEWIYLSIDEDEKKWLKKSQELSEFLNVSNQYLVLKGKNSSLANSLKVNGIPRFVVFDKQNKIVLENAPRPSDSSAFLKIIESIK